MQKIVALMLIMLASSGCGWHVRATAESPDRSSKVTISEFRFIKPAGVRVKLSRGGKSTVLYEAKGDVFLYAAEVMWLPDGKVGIAVCSIPNVRVAGNVYTVEPEKFELVEPALRRRIRSKYALTSAWGDRDELVWFCSSAGTEEFKERFGSNFLP